jgi:hypothetical protein
LVAAKHRIERPISRAGLPSARAAACQKALLQSWTLSTLALAAALCWPSPAHALDGCLVLLCLAAPNWRAIPPCVPPIRQLFRDLARGKPFPACAFSGAGNTAWHEWASAPGNCPPQYTRVFDTESGPVYRCDYSGAVSVTVDGKPWARIWWQFDGGTVTDFAPAAKAQFSSWDTRFDDDYAAWLASLPPPSTCATC